jgi:DNA-binding beta-propeller fold protein YncE
MAQKHAWRDRSLLRRTRPMYAHRRTDFPRVIAVIAVVIACAGLSRAQDNPYRAVEDWAKLTEGRPWGSTAAVDVGTDDHIWVAERCGANSCVDSTLAPILEFDQSGKLVKSFGAGLFVFPHGIAVDKEGNVWVTDGQGKNSKGHQIFKFSRNGQILMTLGKAGVAGDGSDEFNQPSDEFNQPSDAIVAANGDIFVADGHGGNSNARIVKFSRDGKFIKAWGKKGIAPGEFDTPHGLAFDSKGRLFVADRNNNRIQIFDQEGNFIEQWTQFSRPSGIFIDAKDNIYVADSESNSVRAHPGWKRGIRIGSIKDGYVTAFIPDPVENVKGTSAAEGVAADSLGNIYGAEVGPKALKKYVKK